MITFHRFKNRKIKLLHVTAEHLEHTAAHWFPVGPAGFDGSQCEQQKHTKVCTRDSNTLYNAVGTQLVNQLFYHSSV